MVHSTIEFSVRFLRTTREKLPSVSFSFAYISHHAEWPEVSIREDELPRKNVILRRIDWKKRRSAFFRASQPIKNVSSIF